jgi:hypothetical protein
MISRNLSKRVERLETRSGINREPTVLDIDFVSTNGRVVDRRQIVCGGDRAAGDRRTRPSPVSTKMHTG